MVKTFEMELAGRPLKVEVGKVAKQANGAVFIQYGETTLLCTATASDSPREGIDFFPLSVEFEEKFYSVGKFPGGFKKREGKASDNSVLTARVIDRPMRPLFPKDFRNDVTLNNMVMSVDPECRPELVAMIGNYDGTRTEVAPNVFEFNSEWSALEASVVENTTDGSVVEVTFTKDDMVKMGENVSTAMAFLSEPVKK